MKVLGFAIIRWKRLQEIHARNTILRQEAAALTEENHQLIVQLSRALIQLSCFKTAPGTAENGAETKGDDYAKV